MRSGSFTTALSPNLGVLLIGWSLIEGLGAVLVVPAIAALIAANYEGKERALAYGLIGGVAAAAVAVGPIIGGWVTTNFTWRYVFVGEVVIVAVILLMRKRMKQSPRRREPARPRRRRRRPVGVAASASSSSRSSRAARGAGSSRRARSTIDGTEITPLGFSVVPFLILVGFGLLATLRGGSERRERLGREALLDMSMLSIATSAPGCRRSARSSSS